MDVYNITLGKSVLNTSSDVAPSTSSLVVEAPVTPCPSTSSSISLPDPLPSTPKSSQFSSNFSIPSGWRPSIMQAIATEMLTKDIRNEICRDLITHMYGFVDKPTSKFCTFVAQRLILKYPFMRDSKGTGYVSYMCVYMCS